MKGDLKLVPPQKVTIVESIIEQIVTQIRDGSLHPNEQLPSERQLIDMLGVGRSSVREALKGLDAMGLVEIRPGEGTFVRELKPDQDLLHTDIEALSRGLQKEMRKHLNQARLALETGILTIAAEAITKEGGECIVEALEEYEQASRQNAQQMDWVAHDRLHIALAEATGNDFLSDLLQRLLDLVPYSLRDMNLTYADPKDRREFHETWHIIHRKLCEAVLAGDARSARVWMKRHSDYEGINIDCDYGDQPSRPRQEYQRSICRIA